MTLYLPLDPQPPSWMNAVPCVTQHEELLGWSLVESNPDDPVAWWMGVPPVQPGSTIPIPHHGDDSFDRGGQVTHYLTERKVVSVEPVKRDGRWQWKVDLEGEHES